MSNVFKSKKAILNFSLAVGALTSLQLLFVNMAPPERASQSQMSDRKVTDGRLHRSGRILMKMKPGAQSHHLNEALQEVAARRAEKIDLVDIHILELPEQASEKAALERLRRNPNIEFAELDELVAPPSPQLIVNDPYLGSAWHLSKVQAPLAWDHTQGEGVIVAILDTGVNADHPDLTGQVLEGWNFYTNTNNFADTYGHGTEVAGVVAAITNNGIGVSSIAGQSRLLAARISADDGYGSWSAMVSAISWAASKGARVVNMSYSVESSLSVQSAASTFKSNGGITVHSAGNQGALKATADNVMIAVSATGSDDNRTSWSSFGPYVDMAAPGAGIWTTRSTGGYGAVNGTSFSSPLTAAVVALIIAANPLLSPNQVEQVLKNSAVDLGTTGRDDYYGHGRVDALAAVLLAKATAAETDTTAPTVSITSPGSGATVSGIINVGITASDSSGINRVELLINNQVIGQSSVSPANINLDTRLYPEGTLTLIARAIDQAGNIGNSRSVSITVRNIALQPVSISSITPNFVKAGQSVDATISGSNFKAGLKVSFNGNSGSAPTARLLSVSADGLSMRVRISTKSAGKGATSSKVWNIVVTNSDGSSGSLTSAFTVNP